MLTPLLIWPIIFFNLVRLSRIIYILDMIQKTLLLALLLTISSLDVYSQQREVGERDNQGKRTGVWKIYFGNRLDSETQYKAGIKEGSYKNYWRSGPVLQIGQYTNDKRTGQWTLYYEKKGKVNEQGSYLNGKKTGTWRVYKENGELRSSSKYLDGLKSGLYESFWNGTLPAERGNYLENKKIGEWTKYDYKFKTKETFLRYKGTYGKGGIKIGRWEEYRLWSDQLHKLETYNDQGVLNGQFEEYSVSGYILKKGNMQLGKRNGTWTLSENNGEDKITVTYLNGVKSGPYLKKSRTNRLIAKGAFLNDKKDGLWEEVDFNGLTGKGKYKADNKVGPWEIYHPSVTSHPILKMEYNSAGLELSRKQFNENNQIVMDIGPSDLNGAKPYKAYYADGTLKVEGQVKNEKQDGVWKEYHPNGNIGIVKNVSNGLLDGEFQEFYANGQIKLRFSFSNGKLWNILEMNDINGVKLDGGTLKNGNGTIIIYDQNGNLKQVQNVIDGQVQK